MSNIALGCVGAGTIACNDDGHDNQPRAAPAHSSARIRRWRRRGRDRRQRPHSVRGPVIASGVPDDARAVEQREQATRPRVGVNDLAK